MVNHQATYDSTEISSIISYIPDQLKMNISKDSDSTESLRCDTLFSVARDCYDLARIEVRDYNRILSNSYNRNSSRYDCIDFLCREDDMYSPSQFNYRTIQRSISTIPYCLTQNLLCLSGCFANQDIEDSSVFSRSFFCSLPISHLVRAPFCIAGSSFQSALCLIPCIFSNTLNQATLGRSSWLKDFSSTSLLYFSNGLIKKSQVKLDQANVGDDQIASNLFMTIFYQFHNTNESQRANSEEISLIKNFLNSPSGYLDDACFNQLYFVGNSKLDRDCLDKFLSNISLSTQFGSINNTNKFFYIFAYNCVLYNYLKVAENINRSSLPDDDKLSKIYSLHLSNIENLKKFILKRFCLDKNSGNYKESISISQDDIEKTDQSPAKNIAKEQVCAFDKYKNLLNEFFEICENYLGKLDSKPDSSEIALRHEIEESSNHLLLSYREAKEKYDKDKLASRDSSSTIPQPIDKSIQPIITADFRFLEEALILPERIHSRNYIDDQVSGDVILIESTGGGFVPASSLTQISFIRPQPCEPENKLSVYKA